MMKSLIRMILARFGFGIYRLSPSGALHLSHEDALRLAIRNGMHANTVVDVGAAFGNWTRMCMGLLPWAKYVLIEPLEQYDKWLIPLQKQFPDVERVKAAAATASGSTTMFLHEDWVGSSLYLEEEGPAVDGTPMRVDLTTVDEILAQRSLSGPFLLKVDVQGAELQVLEGATATLRHTEYALVETSLFQFFKSGPLIHDVISFMKQQGFVIYDILSPAYRPLDNALGQIDLAFVPERSVLRKEHIYALPEQRQSQTNWFKRNRI